MQKLEDDRIENYMRVAGEELSSMLINIGIFPNLHGYYLLREVTMLMLFNGCRQNMSNAYSALARKLGKSPASIERNIRSAIVQAHNVGKLYKINSLIGINIAEKNYCLTNSQLVNILAEFINKKIQRRWTY